MEKCIWDMLRCERHMMPSPKNYDYGGQLYKMTGEIVVLLPEEATMADMVTEDMEDVVDLAAEVAEGEVDLEDVVEVSEADGNGTIGVYAYLKIRRSWVGYGKL